MRTEMVLGIIFQCTIKRSVRYTMTLINATTNAVAVGIDYETHPEHIFGYVLSFSSLFSLWAFFRLPRVVYAY